MRHVAKVLWPGTNIFLAFISLTTWRNDLQYIRPFKTFNSYQLKRDIENVLLENEKLTMAKTTIAIRCIDAVHWTKCNIFFWFPQNFTSYFTRASFIL